MKNFRIRISGLIRAKEWKELYFKLADIFLKEISHIFGILIIFDLKQT